MAAALSMGVAACGGEAPSGAPSAAPSAAPSSSAAGFDTAGYCAKVCKRASSCGVEQAEVVARGGTASDKAALERVRNEREGVEKACVSDCTAKPPAAPSEVADAQRAETCLQQPDCKSLQSCLESL